MNVAPGNETQKDCCGTMFADLDKLDLNKPSNGKSFAMLVESRGIRALSPQVMVRSEGWDEGTACEDDRDCYDPSMEGWL